MAKISRHTILLVGTLFVLATMDLPLASAAQRHKWWAADEVKAELKLTDTQTDDIEKIFQSLRPKLKKLTQLLDQEEEQLTEIMHAMQAEEWEVTLQIDKVESARSALGKTRTLMLYRMHKKLSATQLDGLHDLWERRRSSRNARTRPRR